MSLFSEIPDYLSLAALSGTVLLTPLYLSQRRDVARLRRLRELEPDHPHRDFAASEVLLDRAERDLEQVLIATGEFTAVAAPGTESGQLTPIPPTERLDTGATPVPPLSRITSDRPALERVTMERDALAPHRRWRKFASTATTPRSLAILGLLAVVIGVAALVASGKLLTGGNEPSTKAAKPGAAAPAGINVTVLNGTSQAGLGGQVGHDVKQSGFRLDSVAKSSKPYQQTVVMFSPGQKKPATKVAHDLGVTPIQPIDSQTRSEAPNADVVVIAGVDRTKP